MDHVASWRLLFEFLLGRERSHFPPCGKTQKLRILGVAGMSQAAACSLSFYLVAKAPFFASQKNVKTLIDGRCGHGKRAPAECSDGGGKKNRAIPLRG